MSALGLTDTSYSAAISERGYYSVDFSQREASEFCQFGLRYKIILSYCIENNLFLAIILAIILANLARIRFTKGVFDC